MIYHLPLFFPLNLLTVWLHCITGWWFGTCFPIRNDNPNGLSWFFRSWTIINHYYPSYNHIMNHYVAIIKPLLTIIFPLAGWLYSSFLPPRLPVCQLWPKRRCERWSHQARCVLFLQCGGLNIWGGYNMWEIYGTYMGNTRIGNIFTGNTLW